MQIITLLFPQITSFVSYFPHSCSTLVYSKGGNIMAEFKGEETVSKGKSVTHRSFPFVRTLAPHFIISSVTPATLSQFSYSFLGTLNMAMAPQGLCTMGQLSQAWVTSHLSLS